MLFKRQLAVQSSNTAETEKEIDVNGNEDSSRFGDSRRLGRVMTEDLRHSRGFGTSDTLDAENSGSFLVNDSSISSASNLATKV